MNDQIRQINPDRLLINSVIKILTTSGSIISIGFGTWHFFVPGIWNWYSYFDKAATELVIAVRAINIFFSLLLVLLGIANILFVFILVSVCFLISLFLAVMENPVTLATFSHIN